MDIRTLAATVLRLQRTVQAQSDTLRTLAQAIAAVNAKTQRAGANNPGTLTSGASLDVSITWPNPWPDTGYAVDATIICGTAALGGLHATLKAGTKTTADCVITVANTGSTSVAAYAIDVIGIRT